MRGAEKFGIILAVMQKRTFTNAGFKALAKRGRSRAGAFARGSSTPPPISAKVLENI